MTTPTPATSAADLAAVREALQTQASALGLRTLGITEATPAARLALYEQWIADGHHGEMGYLSRPDRLARRRDLQQILAGVQRVICVALPYWPVTPLPKADSRHGLVSCYAWGRDYHQLLGERLTALTDWLSLQLPDSRNRWYVDTGPLMERDLAERAGLGFIGKHTLLIDPRYGSGQFLGEILTTAALPCDEPARMPSRGRCQRCLDVCPTQAFSGPYQLDARRCISYLTIEHKGSIPVDLRPLIGNWIYGCDLCQAVCPWNRFARNAPTSLYADAPRSITAPELTQLLALDDAGFQRRFRDSPIARLKRARFLRNVAVALGNSADRSVLPALWRALRDPSPLVVEHVAWAISVLSRCA